MRVRHGARVCARRSARRPEAWRDPGREARRWAKPGGAGSGDGRAAGRARALWWPEGEAPRRPHCPPLPSRGSRSRGSRLRRPPVSGTRSLGGARAPSLRHPPAPAPAAAPPPPPTFCRRRRHIHLLLLCPLLSSPSVDHQVSAAALKSRSHLALCAILLPPLAPEMDLGRWASVWRNGGGLSAPSALWSWEKNACKRCTHAGECVCLCVLGSAPSIPRKREGGRLCQQGGARMAVT